MGWLFKCINLVLTGELSGTKPVDEIIQEVMIKSSDDVEGAFRKLLTMLQTLQKEPEVDVGITTFRELLETILLDSEAQTSTNRGGAAKGLPDANDPSAPVTMPSPRRSPGFGSTSAT